MVCLISPLDKAALLNEVGAELLLEGKVLTAVSAFKDALTVLSGVSLPSRQEQAMSNNNDCQESNRSAVHSESEDGIIFERPLLLNRAILEQAEMSKNNAMTMRATIILNLAIALHLASRLPGNEECLGHAIVSYQVALHHLHTIEDTNGVLIAIFALHNLAVVHYEKFEYEECQLCLHGLWNVYCYGAEFYPSVLEPIRCLEKILLVIFFYCVPPQTAASA